MGIQVSTVLGWTPTASIVERTPLQLTGKVERITHNCTNRDYTTTSPTRQPRAIPKSYPINHSQHSLVNIAPELRNRIYADLLTIEGSVILAPDERVTVPGLVILQTCKQIHDEAASFFYAANSFQCYIHKAIPTQSVTEGQIQCPNITSLLSPRTIRHPLVITGGILFPAPSYHQYLTRLTIGLKVSLHKFHTTSERLYLRHPTSDLNFTRADLEMMHMTVQQNVYHVYQQIMSLWGKRADRWSGSVIMPTRPTNRGELIYWIEFNVDDEEEATTRRTLRGEAQENDQSVFGRTKSNRMKGLCRLVKLGLPNSQER